MVNADLVQVPLQIYTVSASWHGELTLPAVRRVSDLLNDNGHSFVVLDRVARASYDRGDAEGMLLETVAINKRTIIAVVSDQTPLRIEAADRIPKTLHRVVIHAPPFGLMGNLHLPRSSQLFEVINSARHDFIPLTSAMMWWLDYSSMLSTTSEFIAVNRQWITALCPATESPVASAALLQPALLQNALPAEAQ